MAEKVLTLEPYHPRDIFGVSEENLQTIKELFPSIRFVVRGDFFKIFGDSKSLIVFENFFDVVLMHYEKYNSITSNDLRNLCLESSNGYIKSNPSAPDILVHGIGGRLIKAQPANQRRMVEQLNKRFRVCHWSCW